MSELLSVLDDMFPVLGDQECLSNPQAPSSDSCTALCSMHSLKDFFPLIFISVVYPFYPYLHKS